VRDYTRGREGGKGCQIIRRYKELRFKPATYKRPQAMSNHSANIRIQYIFHTIFSLFFGGGVSVDIPDTTLPSPLIGRFTSTYS